MALRERHTSPARARASLRKREWVCVSQREHERSESWAKDGNSATVLWYVDRREGADVIFLADPKAPLLAPAAAPEAETNAEGADGGG